MKGRNDLRLNLLTVQAIVQHYFDTVLFSSPGPEVSSVSFDTSSTTGPALVVLINGAKAEKA